MELLIAIGLPVAAIFGGLVGVWVGKRAADRATVGALLSDQYDALWSDEPRRRAAAVETIRELLNEGTLSNQQRMAASNQLKHWAAVKWELSAEERRRLEGNERPGGTGG